MDLKHLGVLPLNIENITVIFFPSSFVVVGGINAAPPPNYFVFCHYIDYFFYSLSIFSMLLTSVYDRCILLHYSLLDYQS